MEMMHLTKDLLNCNNENKFPNKSLNWKRREENLKFSHNTDTINEKIVTSAVAKDLKQLTINRMIRMDLLRLKKILKPTYQSSQQQKLKLLMSEKVQSHLQFPCLPSYNAYRRRRSKIDYLVNLRMPKSVRLF